MIYAYVRVSTDKQTLENQVFEIENFCKCKGLKIDQWMMEKISGTKDYEKRRLGKIIKKLKAGDILICSEVSRLGRNLFQIMTILNKCIQREAQVWTIKEQYRLGADIQSKVLAFAFSLSAEIERNLISQRTKEALSRLKASGKKLGRIKGSKNTSHILDGKYDFISEQLRLGVSRAQIARKLGVSPSLIYKYVNKAQKDTLPETLDNSTS
ncbi:MAG: master DNA invertase Mpi family serine-type recombinase [Alphaproteobacteria bacterium]